MIDFKQIENFDDCSMSHYIYSLSYFSSDIFNFYYFKSFVFHATKLLITPIASPSVDTYRDNLKQFFNNSIRIVSLLIPFLSSRRSNDALLGQALDWISHLFELCLHVIHFGLLLSLTLISLPTRLLSTFIFGMIASHNWMTNSSTDVHHSYNV